MGFGTSIFRSATGHTVRILAALALLFASPAVAQISENATLVGQQDNYSSYADIWGYDADGTELAIIASNAGVSFVDATVPSSLNEVAYVTGDVSIWRDMKTYGTHCYIINEEFGGLQVVDLSDPLNPILVNTITAQFQTAHNVWVDEAQGLLFAVGANFPNEETFVYDLTSNPVSPTLVHTFTADYVHDMYSANGVAYLGAVYSGLLVTADISNLPGTSTMPVLDTIQTDNAFTHNAWATDDGNYALCTDEESTGHITVVDCSDPSNLSLAGSFVHPTAPNSIIHNVTINGDLAYISWYTTGLQVLDISDPTNPTRVAYYDTFPANDSGNFDGAWGVYPYAPSGNIYVSDISTGLYVVDVSLNFGTIEGKITDAATTSPVANATVEIASMGISVSSDGSGDYRINVDPGTYDVTADAYGYETGTASGVAVTTGVTTVRNIALTRVPSGDLVGTVTAGGSPIANADVVVNGTPLSQSTLGDGTYGFIVPEGAYSVSVDAFGFAPDVRATTIVADATTTEDFDLVPAIVADDFEASSGWTVSGDASTGQWERVDPNGTTAAPEDDHTAAPGTDCFVTGQGSPGGSDGADDVDNGQTVLTSPTFDLAGVVNPTLTYYRWYSNDTGSAPNEDVFRAEISNDGGSSWVELEAIIDSRRFWEFMVFDIDAFVSATDQMVIRFIAEDIGSGSIVEAGIDDLELYGDAIVATGETPAVTVTRLLAAAPTPFRSGTAVRFELANSGAVTVDVFDIQGRHVRRLAEGAFDAGFHAVAWDGRSGTGVDAAPGVYIARMTSAAGTQTMKLVRSR
jgi:choice-of-anchor B domain-containing protein